MDRRSTILRRLVTVSAAGAILLVALATRMLAVGSLGIDFDEDDYLRAGQLYATGLQAGDPGVFLRENYRPEHPPLAKIVVGLAITPLPPAPEIPDAPTTAPPNPDLPEPLLTVARTVNVVFGAAAAGLLALVSPLGGLWLALHTFTVKYTSQVMLEAVPAFFALLSVVLATRAWRPGASGRRRAGWIGMAAIAFGFACAGKYLYGVAGLAIVADWALRARADHAGAASRIRAFAPALLFLALGAVAFLAANPYLWPDPLGRLASSITYHAGYATSDAVSETGWPAWQPLVWLMGSVPVGWQQPGTFVVAMDLVITALAVTGMRRLWVERRVYALWLLLAFAFLLAWPTKWPQYVLVLSAPLSLAAGLGTESLLRAARARLGRLRHPGVHEGAAPRSVRRTARDLRAAFPWLLPGIVGLIVLAIIPIAYEWLLSLTDMRLTSLKDGLQGGVMRESIGGLTGSIPAVPFTLDMQPKVVSYVGTDLLNGVQQGFWVGNTTAAFTAFSVLWMVLAVGLQAVVGIAVALVLERPGMRYTAFWRGLFILPWAIPEVVGAVAWRDILHPEQGMLSQLLGTPVPWPASPELSLAVLLLAGTWMGWPLWMLVATAGLRTIPRSVIEAAELDGAGRWHRFSGVMLPLLLPLLGAAFIVRGIATFNQFYLFWVLGPNEATTTVSTFSYFLIRSEPFLYSVSAAVNIVTIVALGVVVAWFLRWRASAERVAFA
ncbi:MAG TPA: sugar ABC transporter permease [Candidatus Limnocylindrales bacterium]|nr:sugar ABC transporter permease [Candidatus Limnocylindrales bacterium]